MVTTRWNPSGHISSEFGDIAWNYSFEVSYHADTCIVTFRPKIQLTFPDGTGQAMIDAHIDTWNNVLEAAFNNKWKLVPVEPARCEECRDGIQIKVRVKFVTEWTWTDDYEVTLDFDDEGSDMTHWHLGSDRFGVNGGIGALHEVCHMLGLEDEYVNEESYPGKTEADLPPNAGDGVMGTRNAVVLDRHMETIAFNRAKVNDYLPCATYRLERI